jgi:hypothetical protein
VLSQKLIQNTPRLTVFLIWLALIISFSTPSSAENGKQLLVDTFDTASGQWIPVYLKGSTGSSHKIANKQLNITSTHPDTFYGVYSPVAVSGHFYAEVDFGKDKNTALAFIHEKNGKPDIDNFTMINVSTNKNGKVVVSLKDRQDGVDNVLDNTGRLGKKRYTHVLDNQYSVPFTKTNKKFRIFRDNASGFFHLYYSVKKEIRGKQADGWIELAPSKDWSGPNQEFYIALVCISENSSAKAQFNSVKIIQKPTHDIDDTRTGFKATKRDYNWSGFTGDAIVITFGDEFEFRSKDRKFVFWTENNYIPAWHMNNQLLYTYEFVETWGGGSPGCMEPMSDRLRRWSSVELLEDNDVRKVVRWHYVLCDPDYKIPTYLEGTQLPEVDEYWTFYPDGLGLRNIIYTPKLDSEHRSSHELTELIVIAGSLTNPSDHLASPALTVMDITGDEYSYHPGSVYKKDTINKWPQVIATVHFKDAPDAFNVFSTDKNIPETYSHYPIDFDLSWHSIGYKFCHWPVGLEPYQLAFKTFGTWKCQVSHTSLLGAGVHEGSDWNDYYEFDARGRKYRQWVSLVGLNEPGYFEGIRIKTTSWLYPGKVTMLDDNCKFEKINYNKKELVFTKTKNNICSFTVEPPVAEMKNGVVPSTTLINPVVKINDWGNKSAKVIVNDRTLREDKDYKVALEQNALLIWIRGAFDSITTFRIQG